MPRCAEGASVDVCASGNGAGPANDSFGFDDTKVRYSEAPAVRRVEVRDDDVIESVAIASRVVVADRGADQRELHGLSGEMRAHSDRRTPGIQQAEPAHAVTR